MRYLVEQYPLPKGGMQSGYMPPGVKVTDTVTGESHICTAHRHQHLNRAECFRVLENAALAAADEEGE